MPGKLKRCFLIDEAVALERKRKYCWVEILKKETYEEDESNYCKHIFNTKYLINKSYKKHDNVRKKPE